MSSQPEKQNGRDPKTGRFQKGTKPGPGRPIGRTITRPPAIDNETLVRMSRRLEEHDIAALFLNLTSMDKDKAIRFYRAKLNAEQVAIFDRVIRLQKLASAVLEQRLTQELRQRSPDR